jgi:hypothetical protein
VRYLINPCSTIEIQFSDKKTALNYAKQMFQQGEKYLDGVFWPQHQGYRSPEQLVEAVPEYLGEEEEVQEGNKRAIVSSPPNKYIVFGFRQTKQRDLITCIFPDKRTEEAIKKDMGF